jgi:MOSC domain-containing protein YiiM
MAHAGLVDSVHMSPRHALAKAAQLSITLLAGLGVQGDAHAGTTVKHRSRARWNPKLPNLRQVHLIQAELLDELRCRGFAVAPGQMGENVTTRGLDLLALPAGARLRLGSDAVVELTGLRNPCKQLDGIQQGLMDAVLDRDAAGGLVRKAGVMAVVLSGGEVLPGDAIRVELPAGTQAAGSGLAAGPYQSRVKLDPCLRLNRSTFPRE